MNRRYKIWSTTNNNTKEKSAIFISDITDEEMKRSDDRWKRASDHEKTSYLQQEWFRPRVATFPISELYPEDEQRKRAQMLCDYLNKIEEAKDRAERDTAFVDIITAGAKVDTKSQ